MISYLVDTIVVFVVLNLIDPILIPIKIFFATLQSLELFIHLFCIMQLILFLSQ